MNELNDYLVEVVKNSKICANCIFNHDGVCDGCHMKQPPFVEQLVQHNKDLVACTMCGRILYRDL